MNYRFPQLIMVALLATAFIISCSSPEADSQPSVSVAAFEPAALSIELPEEPVIQPAIEQELGLELELEPEPEPATSTKGTFTDPRDGKTYSTVRMPDGNVWMAENMNWQGAGWCYDNDKANCDKYGRLYTWKEAVAIGNAIPGWHLPTDEEWTALTKAVGVLPGTKLKASSWDGTDDFGFSGLPAGDRHESGAFDNIDKRTNWWSATEASTADAYSRQPNAFLMNRINISKGRGYSVRLMQYGACPNTVTRAGTVTCGGRTYRTVQIGTQVWMAENLNYDVPGVTTDVCYDNNPANCAIYGRLYDWETATKVCPSGWHLPSLAEWQELTDYTMDDDSKLKTTSGWNDVNGNGTDDFGFSALPSGFFNGSWDRFEAVGDIGSLWIARTNPTGALIIKSNLHMSYIYLRTNADLFPVRCLQD